MFFNDRRKGLGKVTGWHQRMEKQIGYEKQEVAREKASGGPKPTKSLAEKEIPRLQGKLATETRQKGSQKRIAKGRKKDMKAGY